MGVFPSKPAVELEGDNKFPMPKQPTSKLRVLPLDPRSPTPEIVRTPIQVEKTPGGQLYKKLWPSKPKDLFKDGNLEETENRILKEETKNWPSNENLTESFTSFTSDHVNSCEDSNNT